MQSHRAFLIPLITLFFAFVLIACRPEQPTFVPVEPGESEPPATAATDTVPLPTPTVTATTEPAAVRVNGEGISISEYEAEMERFQAAMAELGKTVPPEEARQRVLDSLVDEVLLAQAAAESGFELTDQDISARLDEVIADSGGEEAFQTWMSANFYSLDSYRRALGRSIAASWQRDRLAAEIPPEIEQVHARQILLLGREQIDDVYRRLQAGSDFATLVVLYDPVTGGDLGWFPQGYLTVAALEEAAFSLQPGEYSEVIESEFGYHILQVLERGVHPLSPDARLTLQRKALQDWLAEARTNSTIEVFLP